MSQRPEIEIIYKCKSHGEFKIKFPERQRALDLGLWMEMLSVAVYTEHRAAFVDCTCLVDLMIPIQNPDTTPTDDFFVGKQPKQ